VLDKILKALEELVKNSKKEREDKQGQKEKEGEKGTGSPLVDWLSGMQPTSKLGKLAHRLGSVGKGVHDKIKKHTQLFQKSKKTAESAKRATDDFKPPPRKKETGKEYADRLKSKKGGADEGIADTDVTTAGAKGAAETAGGGLEGAATGAAEGAALIPGIGEVVIAVGALEIGLLEAAKAAYEFARAQEAEIRKQAEYGPQQAIGIAELDAHRTMRDVQTAGETGSSGQALTQALDRLEEALRPIESLLTNVANDVGVVLVETLRATLLVLTPMAKALNAILRRLPIGPEDTGEKNWDLITRAAERGEDLIRRRHP
jgi:hypothetical protein